MGRKLSEKTLDELKELKSLGFIRSSPGLLCHLRKSIDYSYIKFFKPGVSSKNGSQGKIKYSSVDFFGIGFAGRVSYMYDTNRKKEFVKFLVNKFLIENPHPNPSIKGAFTRMLHNNRLHWEGCSCNEYDKR